MAYTYQSNQNHFFLRAILCKVNIKNDQVDEYIKVLASVGEKKTIDTILCCSFPFESTLAGIQYKNCMISKLKSFLTSLITLWNEMVYTELVGTRE